MSNLKKLKEMLPLYVRGDLTPSEKNELEEALKHSSELQQELRDYSGVRDAYRGLAAETPEPPDNLYHRIMQNIRKEERAETLAKERAWYRKLLDSFRHAFASPRLAWATASLFMIISLAVVFKPVEKIYITLGEFNTDPNIVHLNIVFKEDASEKRIRELLLETETQIVDGPDAGGLYVLSVKMVDQKETALKTLQKADIVRMAEIKY